MKITKLAVLLALAGLCVTTGGADPARAAGTAAGTSIGNHAYADYQDANGNGMTRVYSNTVTTIVSQVAGLEFNPPTVNNTAAGGTTSDFLMQIFNRGNGTDNYTFTYTVLPGNTFTPGSVVFYHDNPAGGTEHVFDGTDTLMTPSGGVYTTVPVAAEDDTDTFVKVAVPGGTANNSACAIAVTAHSAFDNSVVSVGTFTLTVADAVLTANATTSPSSLPPGATALYTLTVTNGGSIAATDVAMHDNIPLNMTYVPGSFVIGGVPKTDASDGDGAAFYSAATSSVTFNLASIGAGNTVVLQFSAYVNAGVPAGTSILHQGNMDFASAGVPHNTNTNGGNFSVAALPDVSLALSGAPAVTGNPGDRIVRQLTAVNNGNAGDVINLAYNSSAGLAWVFWADNNNDGIPGNDGDYILTDSNADGKVDTGLLVQNGSLAVLAVMTIPAGKPDQTVDNLTVTAYSSNAPAVTAAKAMTTTVTAPVLSVVKAVSPAGAQRPGTELTYTVTATNTGTGVATNVIVSDLIPNYTTYKAGSILTGNSIATLVSRTDATDGDGASFDAGTNSIVLGSGSSTSLGTNAAEVLRFTVTIN